MTINMKFGGHFQTNRYRCLISIGKRFHPKAELIQNSGWNRKSEGVCTGGTGPCGAAEAEGEPPGVHYSCWVLPCRRTRWCLMCMYANSSLYIYICARQSRRLKEPPRTSKRKRTVPVFSKVGDFNHCLQFSGEIFGPREETSAGNIEICC